MIDELHVRDIALIEDASLELSAGLTALTGETGAGKTALLAMLLMLATHASLLHAKVEQRPVYICGYAVNFADSAAYVTEIQCIDTAYVESRNGFLMDRNLYSDQLNYFVKKQFGGKHYTCMVLFDKKQARLQKRVERMRKRQENDPSVRLHTIAAADFRFIGEQYIDTSVTMIDEEEAATTEAAAPAPAATAKDKPAATAKKGKKAAKGGKR